MSTPEHPPLVRRLLARREHHRRRSLAYRIPFGVAGALVLAAGVVMLVTPGPAFVLIPVGLAMLALEFAWAERLLVRCLGYAESARERAARTSRAQRILGGIASVLAVAAAVAVALLVDVPILPV
jgi:uncharacterized protein (TIGR02611 family)